MRRRVFLVDAGKAFPIVAGALYLIRCGSLSGSSDVSAIVTTSTVVDGHSHQCTIPASDLQRPTDVSYQSTTSAGHQHMVVLSLAELTNLSLGGVVTVGSTTTAGHRHDFTFEKRK